MYIATNDVAAQAELCAASSSCREAAKARLKTQEVELGASSVLMLT